MTPYDDTSFESRRQAAGEAGGACAGRPGGQAAGARGDRGPVPELLAPAGSLDALLAALAAGADAVYTGLGSFNARASAQDIALPDFARACALAHARGARVYVTENVYLREGELPGALGLARQAAAAGADALIVADAGFARLVRAELPGLELHLSTQAGVMSAAGARLAARELGVERVTVARELSVGEIARVAAAGVPVEAFCHGAICICYSGACAFSALRRGRSANRGDCTQPCRLPYRLVRIGGDGAEAAVDAPGDRLLCPRDYLSVRHLGELARAGVSALKIEGRMKNPDYVFNVVRTYRAALDALAAGAEPDDAALDGLEARLGASFNRGFTDAYLEGTSGAELMSFERAINQGVRVGTVVERGRREVAVELTGPVRAGDTLEIRTLLPEDAAADVPRRFPLVPCGEDGEAGDRIRVRCKRRVAPGSPVHLTASARLVREAADAVSALRAEAVALDVAPPAPCAPPAEPFALRGRAPAPDAPAPRAAVTVIAGTPDLARRLLGHPQVGTVAVRASRLLDEEGWDRLLPDVAVVLDEPCRAADEGRVRALCRGAGRVICRNYGAIELAREAGAAFEAAAPVSATNSETAAWLARLGARRVWLPDELSVGEVRAVASALRAAGAAPGAGALPSPLPGVLVYGPPQLMVCEHCLLTAAGPCDGDHARCARRRRRFVLEEAGGARLPVRVDARGRTRIFDEAPLDRRPDLPALIGAGVGAVMVDAEGEDEARALAVLDDVARAVRATAGAAAAPDGSGDGPGAGVPRRSAPMRGEVPHAGDR